LLVDCAGLLGAADAAGAGAGLADRGAAAALPPPREVESLDAASACRSASELPRDEFVEGCWLPRITRVSRAASRRSSSSFARSTSRRSLALCAGRPTG
jgi:hypothetical protein